ncbi:MAG: NAD(P)-binding protein [Planctomycetes bacterium]|nr:NAD(P)-binding protein [Planctomycetota bacterium]
MDTRFLPKSWRVRGLELPVDADPALLADLVARELGLEAGVMRAFRLVRRSLDARRRGSDHQLRFVHQVEIALDRGFRGGRFARALRSGYVAEAPASESAIPLATHASLRGARVAVLGGGPGGLFAAWMLAHAGLEVELFERGSPVERRGRELVAFHRSRVPNPESNLLYGEGGAGTYSDGKLYTRVEDALELPILEELVACGAPGEILFDARAHVGTDKLHRVLPRLRARLEELGVRFHWNTRVEGLVVAGAAPGARVRALRTSAGETPCDALFLASGHSARDTWNS